MARPPGVAARHRRGGHRAWPGVSVAGPRLIIQVRSVGVGSLMRVKVWPGTLSTEEPCSRNRQKPVPSRPSRARPCRHSKAGAPAPLVVPRPDRRRRWSSLSSSAAGSGSRPARPQRAITYLTAPGHPRRPHRHRDRDRHGRAHQRGRNLERALRNRRDGRRRLQRSRHQGPDARDPRHRQARRDGRAFRGNARPPAGPTCPGAGDGRRDRGGARPRQ